jgi:transitional endoplasmic reticulum ATPase
MYMAKEENITLKIGELTNREEFGRGIVRLDAKSMKTLDIREGDVIELEGQKKTGAIAVRAYPADVGLNLIRMDGIARRNAGVGVGETVKIKKADIKEAKRVVLAPVQKGIILQMNPNLLKKNLFMRPVTKKDMLAPFPVVRQRRQSTPFDDIFRQFGLDVDDFSFSPVPGDSKLMVVSTSPDSIVKITENTEVEIRPEAVDMEEKEMPSITYEDIGGLKSAIPKIREMVELPLRHPELFTRLGIEPPKGVLLYGPPGSGKTLLARAVANESGANFITINGPEIMSKWYGGSEENIRKIFEEAEKNAPSIIFIDEIDAIAPKREEVTGEVERRVVSQLLTEMDGLKSRGKVIVIAATNRQNALDSALRRGGRFDREIEIGVPDQKGRKEILQIHTRNMPLEKVDLGYFASITHGFVGADISTLCKEAAMSALRRNLPDISWKKENIPTSAVEKLTVTKEDFQNAHKLVEPSAMREVMIEIPKVKWNDVGGLADVKQSLKEVVQWPLEHPDSFSNIGIRPPTGVLMYGPPGSGKTLLARAVASESGANFISIKGPEVMSKWVGESEKHVREIFRRARQVAPAIIFFDEMDAIAPRRGLDIGNRASENVVSQILTEMAGLEDMHDVIVIAATNRPDMLDPALLRPGRFDRQILVPAPDSDARHDILKIHTANMPLTKDINLRKMAEETEGFSGADLEALAREAGLSALKKDFKASEVTRSNFEDALKSVKPSVTEDLLKFYDRLEEEIKRQPARAKEEKMQYVG